MHDVWTYNPNSHETRPNHRHCHHHHHHLSPHSQVGLINSHPDYVTTSSCSGRIALFEDVDGIVCRKAGGAWLLSSHAPVAVPAVRDALRGCRALGQAGGSVTLKQEPLVLHVECRDLPAAEALLRVGVASGFRESGISLGKKRVLCAIRTGANSLEVGLAGGTGSWGHSYTSLLI